MQLHTPFGPMAPQLPLTFHSTKKSNTIFMPSAISQNNTTSRWLRQPMARLPYSLQGVESSTAECRVHGYA